MFPKPHKFNVGDRIIATVSKWTGTIIRKTKNKSSPYVVKWDKNGLESNENSMSIEPEPK